NNGEVFFVQPRVGKNLCVFKLYKFKTMNERRDERGELLPDEKRLTKLGKIVRRLSLDELPQLINVVKQDMSLIGPRPLLVDYLPYYSDRQLRRHEVKPGISGWAQVNGRNLVDWATRFELDVWYVDHISFSLDLRILLRTFTKVFSGDGISADGHATMPTFISYVNNLKSKDKK
ncbi:MAG: sugar transferase, partial [Cytophagales bacterium]|nr:sugar transferase [Cytophagales bacterium]